jgi:hypothetical protein
MVRWSVILHRVILLGHVFAARSMLRSYIGFGIPLKDSYVDLAARQRRAKSGSTLTCLVVVPRTLALNRAARRRRRDVYVLERKRRDIDYTVDGVTANQIYYEGSCRQSWDGVPVIHSRANCRPPTPSRNASTATSPRGRSTPSASAIFTLTFRGESSGKLSD